MRWAIDSIMRSSVGLHLFDCASYRGRLKPRLHKQSPPSRVTFLESAKADFVCVVVIERDCWQISEGSNLSDIAVLNRQNDCVITHHIKSFIITLHPRDRSLIPEMTASVAQTSFLKGNPYIKMRDELGVLYLDADFITLFGADCG